MKLAWSLGIVCAVVLHAGVLLFGRLLFPDVEASGASTAQVELLSELETEKQKEKPDVAKPAEEQELEADSEAPPDASEVMRSLELAPVDNTPALEAASLSAIEAALDGQLGGGGDFAEALSFSSGGRIGGTGKGGALEEKIEDAFSLSEIDQKPRPIFQAPPSYPAEMRGKKTEGVVTLIFVVDASGKVVDARVESSSHSAFDAPALSAVKKWKFEAGLRAGQRVACKMRAPIRFPASQ